MPPKDQLTMTRMRELLTEQRSEFEKKLKAQNDRMVVEMDRRAAGASPRRDRRAADARAQALGDADEAPRRTAKRGRSPKSDEDDDADSDDSSKKASSDDDDDDKDSNDDSSGSDGEPDTKKARKADAKSASRVAAPLVSASRKELLAMSSRDLLTVRLSTVLPNPEVWRKWMNAPAEAEERRSRARDLRAGIQDEFLSNKAAEGAGKMGSYFHERKHITNCLDDILDPTATPDMIVERILMTVGLRAIASFIAGEKGVKKAAKYYAQRVSYRAADPMLRKIINSKEETGGGKARGGGRGGGRGRQRGGGGGRNANNKKPQPAQKKK